MPVMNQTEFSLAAVMLVNLLYVVLQLVVISFAAPKRDAHTQRTQVAQQTGSLAMLSDAFHNLSDAGAAWVAFQVCK